ncbi:MAG: SBBP repeat-containing protein [Candidatus Zixiibacteriota bacterium]
MTGFVEGWASGDILTIRYYPNGDTAWVRTYGGSGSGLDTGLGVAVDDSGNVYVAGPSTGSGTGFDYTTIKYDSTGSIAWVETYDGPANGSDWLTTMRIDGTGNVYVTGSSQQTASNADYLTIKYTQTQFLRGDANGDDIINVGDIVYLVSYLYKGGPEPVC